MTTTSANDSDVRLMDAIAERDLDLIADAVRAGAPAGQDAREALAALFDLDQPSPFHLKIKKIGKGVFSPFPAWFDAMVVRHCAGELAAGVKKTSIRKDVEQRFGVGDTKAKEYIKQAESDLSSKGA